MLKIIFGKIWAVWGILVFFGSLLLMLPIVIPTSFYAEPKKSEIFYKISVVWMRIFLALTGCPLKLVGKQHFAPRHNYIVTTNHNAFLDVPIASPFIPATNKTIGKIEFSRIPIFNLMYNRGAVLVDRKSDQSRAKSYDDMKIVLSRGWHMGIYPEGTRNKTNEPLQPFKNGAFRLAVETNTSIIPCLIFNTKKAMPSKYKFILFPTKLEMHFLAPIAPAGKTIDYLKNEVYDVMKNYYVSNYIP